MALMPAWVQQVGFSNIIFVLFMGRFLIPWEALGFDLNKVSRFSVVWKASHWIFGALTAGSVTAPRPSAAAAV